jgi:protein tyrosine/serine phosphatase
MGATYFSYIEPYLFPLRMLQGEARHITERIIVGPYPHEKDIEKLVKIKKVSLFISLLNPGIPFEKSLIEKEKKILASYGVKFYNVPLSFISLNSPHNYRQIDKILEVVKSHPKDKIYIHCYLGRHRVGFVADRLLGSLNE